MFGLGKLLSVVKKGAKAVEVVSQVVPVPGLGAATALIQKGTKRFQIDKKGAKKIAKGAGIALTGVPVGMVLMGLCSSFLPESLTTDPVREYTQMCFVAIGSVVVNIVRKFLTQHPEIQAYLDGAVDKG